jgi:hypothetical protein
MFNFGKKKEMSDSEKKAKLSALGEAHKMASDMMKDSVGGLKKVTVAADSKKGLKEGLDKAEDMLGEQEEEDSEMGLPEDEEASEYESAQDESEPMDMDELDAEIERLMKLKEKLQD